MGKFLGYRCSLCGAEYSPTEITYTCPKDGGNVDVILDYEVLKNKYEPDDILSRNDLSLWRYLPLLPVSEPEGEATPLHVAGGTPVFKLTTLAQKLGLAAAPAQADRDLERPGVVFKIIIGETCIALYAGSSYGKNECILLRIIGIEYDPEIIRVEEFVA